MATINRQYRDRLFTFIFGSEEHRDWTLSLYNAVNGTSYDDPGQIAITTIRKVLYLGMHNDVSFLLADEMNLYEQQSTYNPNMPLRMLQYAGQLYEKYVKEHRLNKYGKSLLRLPTPKLVVFYNGIDEQPDEAVLRLSDSFHGNESSDIEVRVRMVNINHGRGAALMGACNPLREYAWTVDRIRGNMKAMDKRQAIDEAIEAMPDGFVIKSYLQAHKAEVRDMLLTEYNEAEAMELFREDGRREGREEGRAEGREEGRAEGRAEGREATLVRNLQSLMQSLGCTAEEAMDHLHVPVEERSHLMSALEGSAPADTEL